MLAFVYVPSRSLFAFLVLPILAVFLAVATLPAIAGAAVFCAPAPCSEGTPAATIQDALDAADANAGPDVVAVPAGTHNVGTGLQNLDEETELRGAGVGETIITGDDFPLADPGTGRTLVAGRYSSLHDITLRLPSAVTSGPSSWTGADIYDAVVEDLAVDAVGATFGPGLNDGAGNAMLIRSGTIRNLDIDIPLDADASGLQAGAIGGTFDLADVTISAPLAFTSVPQASPGPVTVRAKRFRITSNRGIQVVDGFLELSDSVIDVSAAPSSSDPEDFAVGVQVFDGRPPNPAGLTMDRVTLIGNGDANATAMSVAGQGGIPATNLEARHVAASGFGRTLGFANFSSNPSATISFSNVPTGTGSIFNFGEDPATLGGDQTSGNRGGEPMLLPDLGLPFGSPAVDIGGADLLPGDATDLAGNPRPADGDGDGTVLNDAGAFERVYSPDGATLTIKSRKVKLNRKGRGAVALTCPPATEQPSPCTTTVKLKTRTKVRFRGKKRRLMIARSKQVTIPAGKTKVARIRVKNAKLKLLLKNRKSRKVVATARVTDGNGERGTVTRKLKLKP